jgi:UDP-2,3-diacylglucosamine pyrophosphatase LpxH
MTTSRNTLIISDIHLGEDLNPQASRAHTAQLALLERQLGGFLRHYTRTRHDGRPWRLVINGDLVDFLGICLRHDDDRLQGDPATDPMTPDEIQYGLGRRPRVAAAKMAAVVDRHPNTFRALAGFLGVGNTIDVVVGNHDAEFQWATVQEAFKDGVARSWATMREARRAGARGPADIAAAITFHPWFFYEPGVAWIEHGHLYDENCSFEYALAHGHPEGGEIVSNVDSASARYVTNRIPEADPHKQDNWSALGYLRWGKSLGLRGLLRLARGYFAFSGTLLATWRRRSTHASQVAVRRTRHRERLTQLGESWRLSEATMTALDELREKPVVTNLWRLMRVLMLDRLVIIAVALLVLLGAVASLPWHWALAAALATVGSAWWTAHRVSRHRNVDPTGPLKRVPEQILRHVDARFVVFGHTHQPERIPLAGGGTYLNTGTWFPTEATGLLRSFTHVIIRHSEAGPIADLCQWRDGASRAFTPGRQAQRARTQPGDAAAAAEQAA